VCRRCKCLQNPPHKRHGFRSITHNPEVSGSNPLPATKSEPEPDGLWFFISQAGAGGISLWVAVGGYMAQLQFHAYQIVTTLNPMLTASRNLSYKDA
jgi:hypothetical protein